MTNPVVWPNGAQCAVMLTFDFDAETLWLGKDPSNRDRPGLLSIGKYGANVGVSKILELLANEALPATFFIPGWTVENHTARVEEIIAGGYEIAHHGYLHRSAEPDNEDIVREEIERGLDALKRVIDVCPEGHRAPSGDLTEYLLRLLSEHGFLYNSNFKDNFVPYRHTLADGSDGVIELPLNPTLDDGNFGLSAVRSPRPLYPKEWVLSIWQDEFRETYDWGGLFILTMHPQITGRPMRLATLREFIAFTRTFPNVWYATGSEVARAWDAQQDAAV